MTLTVLIGASGSGKSTFAKHIIGHSSTARILSADNFFQTPKIHEFNPAVLPQAHGKCLRDAVEEMRCAKLWMDGDKSAPSCCHHLVIDNTNTTIAEIAPYIALGKAYNAHIQVFKMPYVPPEIAATRCIHGVPLTGIIAQQRRIEAMIKDWPPYWPTIQQAN